MNNKIGELKIADDVEYKEYDRTPIDSFGKEMLFKMGWKDNTPLRKDGPIKPIEFIPRVGGLGLGANPLNSEIKKSDKKSTNSFYGSKVKVIEGKHKGLKGKIIEKDIEDFYIVQAENKYIYIELKINKEVIKIQSNYLRLRSEKSKKEKKHKKSNKSDYESNEQKNKYNNIAKSHSRSLSRSRSRSRNKEQKMKNVLKWVCPNIIVRIICKENRYYNKKGVIHDLLDLRNFSIFMLEDKTLHTNFTEDDIETVMPGINEDVIILNKEHKGEKAKLIQRDKKLNKVGVQLNSDLNIIYLTQDDVAAYCPM